MNWAIIGSSDAYINQWLIILLLEMNFNEILIQIYLIIFQVNDLEFQ